MEDFGEQGDRSDTLLDAGTAGVVDADDGAADLQREFLHLDDLAAVGFGKRTAEHSEVVGEDRNGAAVDCAQTADHAVAVGTLLLHAELVAVVADELVDLLERAGVEEFRNAFAGGLLAAVVLAFSSLGIGSVRVTAALNESGQPLRCRLRCGRRTHVTRLAVILTRWAGVVSGR